MLSKGASLLYNVKAILEMKYSYFKDITTLHDNVLHLKWNGGLSTEGWRSAPTLLWGVSLRTRTEAPPVRRGCRGPVPRPA